GCASLLNLALKSGFADKACVFATTSGQAIYALRRLATPCNQTAQEHGIRPLVPPTAPIVLPDPSEVAHLPSAPLNLSWSNCTGVLHMLRTAVIALGIALSPSYVWAQARIALLIGNQSYDPSVGVLKNPL